MKTSFTPLSIKILLPVLFLFTFFTLEARILFVNISATGSGDGSSWSDAFTDLQDAINVAVQEDTICVAAGTYIPTHVFGTDLIRSATFYINKSILVFGGFSGTPGTEGNFAERNPQLHATILNGDTGIPGDDADNAFHVVYFDHVSETTRLDGFTITKGNGEGGIGLDTYGAGIHNDAIQGISSPILANCIISDNKTTELGGGMMNNAQDDGEAKPLIVNCAFINNQGSSGGALGNYADNLGVVNPLIINCSFIGNSAPTGQGGAISSIAHGSTSTLKLFNCIFTGNHSPTSAAISCFSTGTSILCPEVVNCALSGNTGGALRVVDLGDQLSKIIVRNSIFWKNGFNHGLSSNGASTEVTFSIMQFGFNGEGNLSEDPLFADEPPLIDGPHTIGDLHPESGSPAIDAGRNSDVDEMITTDLDKQPRYINPGNGQTGTIDIGPYELQSFPTSISALLSKINWQANPNPVSDQIIISTIETGNISLLNIFDNEGRIVSKQQLNTSNHQVDVSHLPSGIYFLHLIKDGLHDVKKIVVE